MRKTTLRAVGLFLLRERLPKKVGKLTVTDAAILSYHLPIVHRLGGDRFAVLDYQDCPSVTTKGHQRDCVQELTAAGREIVYYRDHVPNAALNMVMLDQEMEQTPARHVQLWRKLEARAAYLRLPELQDLLPTP